MDSTGNPPWTFNLMHRAWIDVASVDGGDERRLSLRDTLISAHELRGFTEPSPLYVVGLYRLLVAVLQDALGVAKLADVVRIWQGGSFSADAIHRFADRFSDRFDVFSADMPFLQSGDLPLAAMKGDNVKPVGYLAFDMPTATAINHFRHVYDEDQCLCPRCAAMGLVTVPAFASSGGAGIKPSINGVPPLYVLPVGDTLFASLTLGLVSRNYQPAVRSEEADLPWWRRDDPDIAKVELEKVGYLQSLTFPARRVRLHPCEGPAMCSRCGESSSLVVRTMVFDMGESRPKDAAFWRDPFAAYRLGKKEKPPVPLRPNEGKALWREFAGLFLPAVSGGPSPATLPPTVVQQVDKLVNENEGLFHHDQSQRFRCIGIRTDMKAKVFEWVDAGFDVPLSLLGDAAAAIGIASAVRFVEDAVYATRAVLRRHGSAGRREEMRSAVSERMTASLWASLTDPFRRLVLQAADIPDRSALLVAWGDQVLSACRHQLERAVEALGDDGEALRHRAEALADFGRRAAKLRQAYTSSFTEA